jgi:asparagine synthase (glutamine-hydrolysing)
MRWADYIPSILKAAPSRYLARLVGPSRRGRGFLLKVAGSPTERLLQDAKFFDDLSLEHLLVAQGPEKNISGQDQMLDLYLSVQGKSDLERFLRADFQHYMVDDILTKMDRCSMAHGLEVRVPILDHKVVELAFRMPTQLKFNKSIKKYPLKTAFGGHLTESVLNHRKQGFYAPIKEWFAGDLGDYCIDRVFSSDNKSGSLLDRVFVERLLRDHRVGKRNHAERLWSILMLEEWCRSPLGNRARLV